MKILILDAANPNTLAIIRKLGKRKELYLDAAGYHRISLGFFSKYTSGTHILTHPKTSPGRFYAGLLDLLKKGKYDLLMPVGYLTHKICSDHEAEISGYTRLVIPSPDSFNLAASKIETYKLAERLGIPCPKTYYINSFSEINKLNPTYPLVIKAPFELGKSVVAYAHDQAEMLEKVAWVKKELQLDEQTPPVIQEYVHGGGYGFFAYYENGNCLRTFMHKRIREYPASGGASVCAEGFYDVQLARSGKKMLDELKWNGVAMVEFKKDDKTGDYKLMEINPKFWGSLELALRSGVDFPLCLVQRVTGEPYVKDGTYKLIRFHWILNGELYHFLSRPLSFFNILRDMFTAESDISWRDPLPNLIQIGLIPVHYYKKLKSAFSGK